MRNAPVYLKELFGLLGYALLLLGSCGSPNQKKDPPATSQELNIHYFRYDFKAAVYTPVAESNAEADSVPTSYIARTLLSGLDQISSESQSRCSLTYRTIEINVNYIKPSVLGNLCMLAIPYGGGPRYPIDISISTPRAKTQAKFHYDPFVSWSLLEALDAKRFKKFLFRHLN